MGEIKYSLGNQDVDTSLVTLEMTWSGVRVDEVKDYAGVRPLDSFVEVIKGKTINYYVDSDRLKEFSEACSKSLITNRELLEKLRSGTIAVTNEIRELAERYINRVNDLSDEKIVDLLIEIKKLQARAMTLGSAVAFADIFGGVTNSLTAVLKSRPNLRYGMHAYTHVFGSPVEKSLTEKAYGEIRVQNDDESLLKKYFWLDQGYIGRGLTLEQLQEIRKQGKKEEEFPSADELRGELGLNENEERVFEVSRSLIQIKSLRADLRQFLHVLTNRIIDRIAQKFNVKPEYLEALYMEEVIAIIRTKVIPENVEERWRHSVVVPSEAGYRVLFGKEADGFLRDNLIKSEIEDVESCKGQVAHPGIVRGKVKLVFGPQHNNKVQEGEILISKATSPQVLPAMQKAAAFVTDVGGITSHAAIVAREMKKPCVVGTKHATEIFNDGDFVEVDANEGIVKIIKRAEK